MALRLFYAWAVRVGHVPASPAGVAAPSHRPRAARTGVEAVASFPEAWIEPVTGWVAHQRAGGRSESSVKV